MKKLLIAALLLAGPAHGQTTDGPIILLSPPSMAQQEDPSWEAKKATLMQGTKPRPIVSCRFRWRGRKIKTNRIRQRTSTWMTCAKFSRRANMKTDICARYHMHKDSISGGRSWRCK